MAVLIDTDVLIDLERGASSAHFEQLVGDESAAISVITVSELVHGALRATGKQRSRRNAFVENIIGNFQSVPITEIVARVHADVWATMAAKGTVIGAHDLWIAATAVAHGFGVVTGNAEEYRRVPSLRVLALK